MNGLPETVLGVTDALIFVAVVTIGILLAVQPRQRRLMPSSGGVILLAGLFLAAFLHVAEEFSPTLVSGSGMTLLAGYPIPEWLFWVFSRTAILLVGAGMFIAYLQSRRLDEEAQASQEKTSAIRLMLVASESRFRGLLETTSNSIYCYAFDPPLPTSLPAALQVSAGENAFLSECNQIYAQHLQRETPAAASGTTFGNRLLFADRQKYQEFFSAFIESGYRLVDYEISYKSDSGEERAVRLNITGILENGTLLRMWGMESDVLDFRIARKALDSRLHFQSLLSEVSTKLVTAPYSNADTTITNTLANVARYFGGNRITLGWVNRQAGFYDIIYQWHEGAAAARTNSRVYESEYPAMGEKLKKGEAIQITDLEDVPDAMRPETESLRQLGIKSLLFQPMSIEGDVVGAVTIGNDQQLCHWTDQTLQDLRVFAELYASFVLRLRQKRTLDVALADLRIASERLEAENVYLRDEIRLSHDFEEIIGESDALRGVLQLVEQVADTMAPVMILGETGTGKELIARALHEHSRRSNHPLVKVNCATLPANLIESELFGYEKGAFTGATQAKRGRFDLADGSTIFLDEIAEFPVELQAKLLRVLQEGEFERLGGTETIKVEVRVVAATNQDMWQAVSEGRFRADLLYRINTFPIELPPLRDRGEDIGLLAKHFVRMHAPRTGRDIESISADTMYQLDNYHWPGNVRELEGVIQRALISGSGTVLELGRNLGQNVAALASPVSARDISAMADLKTVERDHIVAILNDVSWKISGSAGAAAKLGMPPSTLRSKMKKLDIHRPAP
jgi:transcriptional regulator with GAF, ATPase, and Fis domain